MPPIDQQMVRTVEPLVLDGLLIEERAGVGRGERHLDRVRVDLHRVADRLLDRLLGLARQPEDERAVDDDAELVAVAREAARDVDEHALLDVVQDLLVAALVADEQQSQAVALHDLERAARHVRLRVARPRDAELAELDGERLDARQVVGQRVVVEEDLLDLGHLALHVLHFLDDVRDRTRAVVVSADRLRPQAERASALAAAARVEAHVRMLQVAAEVASQVEVALVDRASRTAARPCSRAPRGRRCARCGRRRRAS